MRCDYLFCFLVFKMLQSLVIAFLSIDRHLQNNKLNNMLVVVNSAFNILNLGTMIA